MYRSLPDGGITQANRALLELFGVESDDDLTGYDASHFYVDVADRDHLADLLKDNDVVVGFEARMRRVDGQVIWVRDTSTRIETENGVIFEGATIGQIALESDDISDDLRNIVELVSRVIGGDGVVVLQRLSEGEFQLTGSGGDCDFAPEFITAVADRGVKSYVAIAVPGSRAVTCPTSLTTFL